MSEFITVNGCDILWFREIDSTNSEAKRRRDEASENPLVIVADSQSKGRGRLGRSFYSPSETGLYMSVAYTPRGDLGDSVTITSQAAVAVCRAIEKFVPVCCKIKWVNDVYVAEKKVCGILCESTVCESGEPVIIVGVGINLTTKDFPEEIADRAAAVGEVDRKSLAAELAHRILEFAFHGGEWIEEYRARSLVLGREITYIRDGEEHAARGVEVRGDGALIVEEAGGRIALSSGEISVRF